MRWNGRVSLSGFLIEIQDMISDKWQPSALCIGHKGPTPKPETPYLGCLTVFSKSDGLAYLSLDFLSFKEKDRMAICLLKKRMNI